MATRHRIPSIFNLSMVDVLCCALGCVILLWLLNLRQARQSGSELTNKEQMLAAKRAEAEELAIKLDSAMHDLDDLSAKLRMAKKSLAALDSERAALKDERDSLQANLAKSKK